MQDQKNYSEDRLLNDLEAGDLFLNNRAIRYLYKVYYPMALKFVKANRGTDEDVNDVFQESLIAFYENIKNQKFRGDSTIKTYIYSTIRNNWFSKLKKSKPEINIEDFEFKTDEQKKVDRETLELLKEILNRTGDSCRRILKYYYYDNLSMRDIMREMDFSSEQSAKTQKYKCMQKMIKILEDKPYLKEKLLELL